MALAKYRIFEGGQTDYPWERDAIDHVLKELPDSDPHLAWPLHELYDAGTGRLYEIDLLVLARRALFLIEIKSHPGVLTGDIQDWTFTEEGGRPRHLACPFRATNHKAKVLATLLSYQLDGPRPFVEPLVFVAHPETRIRLAGGCPKFLVTRSTIRQRLVHGSETSNRRVVNRPMMKSVREAMRLLGLSPGQTNRVAGGFKLDGNPVDENENFQEHLAKSTTVKDDTARVRSYLVPKATSSKRRHQLVRAAQREAEILARLGHHPNILSYRAYDPDGSLGPAVIFKAFAGGLPLQLFLREEPELGFEDRLDILQAVVEAVDHCHRAEFLHRNLSPASVLVRRGKDGIEVRIHRFQTAAQSDHPSFGTHHMSQLTEETDRLYQAPEVLRDPRQAVPASDVFSIGCLAWFLFTGQHPAATVSERERLIDKDRGLHIQTVRADLANLDPALALATALAENARPDSALGWFEDFLLDDLTRPTPSEEERRDPYGAEKGDKLAGNLVVERVLGSGATAKVLKVSREGHGYALKVPHDDGCGRRLREEGQVIGRLRHEHIIQLHEARELGGRYCLLLDFAGVGDQDPRHNSFADLLRAEGILSLDKARRYGGDLLSAVQYLEEHDITHRDIKPGNLGFTSQKKARHLTLYDFSLSAGEVTAVRAGTPEWRDPWLHVRERWDSAADRYSVAAVLYRMLTGTRAELARDGPDQGQVRVEAERFDPAVRDSLTAFFRRCFSQQVADRYQTTEEMRTDWEGLFSTPAQPPQPSAGPPAGDILASATQATLVEALPLSARARNALDRAGVVTVAHLLQLPRNHLSAIRGVGQQVSKEIVGVASRLGERLSVHDLARLVADYGGPHSGLDDADMDLKSRVVSKLQDAGVTSTTDLARMPAECVERLLGPEESQAAATALQALAQQQPLPGTLSQWAEQFLAPRGRKKTAAEGRIRALLGLDPLPEGQAESAQAGTRSITDVARAFAIKPPLVHSSLQAMRRRWQTCAGVEQLETALGDVLARLGPVVSMASVAAEMARTHGADDSPTELPLACGLVRLATELRPPCLHWRRLGTTAWVASSPDALDALAALANEADGLAGNETLDSTETVRDRLTARANGTALEVIAADHLVKLAADASSAAAASARLELYPRAMPAERALRLSLNVLTPPGLTPDLVRERVHRRYPAAQPVPGRPELDRLLEPHELFFEPQSGEYQRPGMAHPTISSTIQVPSRQTSAQPHQLRLISSEALQAQAFQDALDRGIESGRFRVVQVRADYSEKAIALLAESLGVKALSLDHQIWQEIQAKAVELGVDPENIITTDRAGPGADGWEHLQELVGRATTVVIESILADRSEPALLVYPGILARFELAEPLNTLSCRASP